MKKLFFLGLTVLCLAACKPGIPDDVLKPEQMQKILFDMHIADGYIAIIPSQDSVKKVGAIYYKGIYKKFGTDSAAYNRSLNYYYKHPDQFTRIYTVVVAQLRAAQAKQAKADAETEQKKSLRPVIKTITPENKKNALP